MAPRLFPWLVAVVLVATGCSSGSSRDGGSDGGCLVVNDDYFAFTVCQLSAETSTIVFGRFRALGAPVPYWDDRRNCERQMSDVIIDVSHTVKGPAVAQLDFEIDGVNSLGSLDASVAQDGLFFLWPYSDGRLGIMPTGGYFWQSEQDQWVNITSLYPAPGLTSAQLSARLLSPDGGVCAHGP